jgi:hypothetical protein
MARSIRPGYLECILLLAVLAAVASHGAVAQGVPTPVCSLEYEMPADLIPLIPSQAQNGDFFEFSWKHFLALSAPTVGGRINLSGDNVTQWATGRPPRTCSISRTAALRALISIRRPVKPSPTSWQDETVLARNILDN